MMARATVGAMTERNATPVMRMIAINVASSTAGRWSSMIDPCAVRAGTEPLTPTTWSRGSKNRSPYLRAARVWLLRETRGSKNR